MKFGLHRRTSSGFALPVGTIPLIFQIEEVLFGIMQSTEFNRAYVPGDSRDLKFPTRI